MSRIVSWFSCGAASAIATKLAIADNDGALPLVVAYTEVAEEHEDNRRFLEDCERWFGVPIQILRNDNYGASIYEVFIRSRFLKGPRGAACTRLLKKQVRADFQQHGDINVFGFTVEEQHRLDRMIDANSDVEYVAPLIDRQLTKSDCLAMLRNAGIEIPAMYRLGYRNNNCIGCVKGEAGYWNKIRRDFPDSFERMSQAEQMLGRTICKIERTVNGKRTIERVYLKDLPPDQGNYPEEQDIDCGIFCAIAEKEYA